MRLINAHTLKVEEFTSENVEQYAILSHRWENGEVSFQDMQNLAVASSMKGFVKIQKSCEEAVNYGFDYLWMDTCCINKESSAELTEAINSMYRWYKASAVCYAFLSDVGANAPNSDIPMEQQIKSSLWFTRGWTLQELLAPQHVVFYDQQWKILGTKQTMSKLLTLSTGIDEAILNGEPLFTRSIAQRMSWASRRVTTRIEDTVYCLLGIFDVNMPMLYGEGEKAFLRLQEEIIKQSDDHSIFAWPIHRNGQPGLLADSPAAFADCQHIKTVTSRKNGSPYSLTNRGLSIELLATPFKTDTYLVRLDCADDVFRLGIFLRRLNEDDQYARVKQEGNTIVQLKHLDWNSPWGREEEISERFLSPPPSRQIEIKVRQRFTASNTDNYKDRINGFRIANSNSKFLERSSSGRNPFKVSAFSWDRKKRVMSMHPRHFGTVGFLDISQQGREIKVIKLGFDFECNPVCFIATAGGLEEKFSFSDRLLKKAKLVNLLGLHGMEDEIIQRRQIHMREPFDTMGWCEVVDGTSMELGYHPGLWALKGDRLNGLSARVGRLALLKILRGEIQGKVVWDLYLDDLDDDRDLEDGDDLDYLDDLDDLSDDDDEDDDDEDEDDDDVDDDDGEDDEDDDDIDYDDYDDDDDDGDGILIQAK